MFGRKSLQSSVLKSERTDNPLPSEEQMKLIEQKEILKAGGGNEALLRQHSKGKLSARERLNLLYDDGTFVETGLFVKHQCSNFDMADKVLPGDGVITGYGLVNGRLVYSSSQDFTVAGGTVGYMHAKKINAIQDAALKAGAPLVCINDSGGARIQEGIDALAGYGEIFSNNVKASGVIPQIAVIMGPCAGGASYSPSLMDFVFMAGEASQMYITGPSVVKMTSGENISGEELGGKQVHAKISGCTHFISDTEEECFSQIKTLLSYLPQNSREKTPLNDSGDNPYRENAELNTFLPKSSRTVYDVSGIIRILSDDGKVMEYMQHFAPNIFTGFIRIGGIAVGIVANQPYIKAGALDIDASDKASRFVRTCDAFNIPLGIVAK